MRQRFRAAGTIYTWVDPGHGHPVEDIKEEDSAKATFSTEVGDQTKLDEETKIRLLAEWLVKRYEDPGTPTAAQVDAITKAANERDKIDAFRAALDASKLKSALDDLKKGLVTITIEDRRPVIAPSP